MWFASKCISLQYHKQLPSHDRKRLRRCDLLPNVYLCNIISSAVLYSEYLAPLWFASKCISLQYHKQQKFATTSHQSSCDLLPNVYLCNIISSKSLIYPCNVMLWFASKCISLQYHKQLPVLSLDLLPRCDLLPNVYLCNIISSPIA